MSVIIPAYNTGPYIQETLDSVLCQTYPHREVIVVDDGSTDDTAERLRPYRSRIQYIRQTNAGVGAARNTGFRASAGEYIAWLDSDDVWLPRKLEIQLQIAARHPEAGLIVCDGVQFEGPRILEERLLAASLRERLLQTPHHEVVDDFYRDFIEECAITCPAQTLMPRHAVEQVGAMLETRLCAEDYDYYLRMARLFPVAFHGEPLVRYRYRPSSLSGPLELREYVWALGTIAVLRRHRRLARVPDRPLVRRRLKALVREQQWVALHHLAPRSRAAARAHLLTVIRVVPWNLFVSCSLLALYLPSSLVNAARRWRDRGMGR